jgi:uncharacterized membrane protein
MSADSTSAQPSRVGSIDIVRGAVMVLMAIDHVRVFSGLPAGGPAPGIFFTRWVTHFCAPAFIFLAGTSAFLYGRKIGDTKALSRFLAIRGAWLVLLELTVLRFAWTFNFDYAHYALAGVIWVIGWCMVLLSVLVWMPTWVVGAMGVLIVGGHNVADGYLPRLYPAAEQSGFAWFWQVLYLGGPVNVGSGGAQLAVLYSLVPWIGVMAAGYAFGTVMLMDRPRRSRYCVAIGVGAVALFAVLRGFNLYGNPAPWGGPQSKLSPLLSFLATNKYPASLDFLLMTLGPTIAVMPLLEEARGAAARMLTMFGRVPFFFYVLHIPLIHLLAMLVSLARSGSVDPWLFANHPMMNPPAPAGYVWSLGLLYAVWAVAVALLYFPCRWFEALKREGRHPAFRYL